MYNQIHKMNRNVMSKQIYSGNIWMLVKSTLIQHVADSLLRQLHQVLFSSYYIILQYILHSYWCGVYDNKKHLPRGINQVSLTYRIKIQHWRWMCWMSVGTNKVNVKHTHPSVHIAVLSISVLSVSKKQPGMHRAPRMLCTMHDCFTLALLERRVTAKQQLVRTGLDYCFLSYCCHSPVVFLFLLLFLVLLLLLLFLLLLSLLSLPSSLLVFVGVFRFWCFWCCCCWSFSCCRFVVLTFLLSSFNSCFRFCCSPFSHNSLTYYIL